MKRQAVLYIGAAGLLAGFLVSVVMTFLDWRLNPGGIFRNTSGTDWVIVAQTAWSWFWPVALLVIALAAPVVVCMLRRKSDD